MRIVIAGCRDFIDEKSLFQYCDAVLKDREFYNPEIDGDVIIVQGEARGADLLGKKYAQERGYACECFPAQWNRADGSFDRAAGMRRNGDMAKVSQGLIAFWDGESRGTGGMLKIAESKKLKIRVYMFTRNNKPRKT